MGDEVTGTQSTRSAEFAGMLIVENGRVSYNKISLLQESNLVALWETKLQIRKVHIQEVQNLLVC